MKMLLASALISLSTSTNLFAQEAAATPAAPNPLASMVPFALIFGIFYFLMLRPQKKRAQEEQAMLTQLSKGDEVITKSGLFGVIYGLSDKVVTLEVAEGVKLKVLRSYIAGTAKKVLEEISQESKNKTKNTKENALGTKQTSK